MRDLNFELKQLCQRNRDGSFSTQYARERILTMIANQLHEKGFEHMRASSLKPKHVQALVERWKAESLSAGTIKNRMTELRWWAEKVAKQNVLARANDFYGIPQRNYVTNVDRSRVLSTGDLDRLTDPWTRMSLRLQAAFGLRREESIKIRPEWADRGDRLALKASWTKGGREREIPIRTVEQRKVLDEATRLAVTGSLIPNGCNYVQQLQRFKAQCSAAGIHHVHGHRHQYAQQRYRELTGWECPAQGGPTRKQLTYEQQAIDRRARFTISHELGHGRESVASVYLGR
ncbi:MAG: integrase [Betaproteobacteria bacterium]|nr:MAG: integrase [Betaproteobacteria bacterium]